MEDEADERQPEHSERHPEQAGVGDHVALVQFDLAGAQLGVDDQQVAEQPARGHEIDGQKERRQRAMWTRRTFSSAARRASDFVAFLVHMAPLSALLLTVYLVAARWLFRDLLDVDPELRASLLELNERDMITHPGLLRMSLAVLGLTLIGFLLHGPLHLEPATIALSGAILLMVLARESPEEVLREVEWPTLFFFIGLFMLVAGVIEIGLIGAVADAIVSITGGALGAHRCWCSGYRPSCPA